MHAKKGPNLLLRTFFKFVKPQDYEIRYPYKKELEVIPPGLWFYKMKKISEGALLAILAAVQFTNIVDFMIMMPLGDLFQRELGIQPFQYSILVSAYPMAAFLSSLFGVFFLDKFDRKKALRKRCFFCFGGGIKIV